MRVVIAGGHGKIAQLLIRRLAATGDVGVGLIRNPDHESDVVAAGGEAVAIDLETASVDDLVPVLRGADAAVFAAGAGAGSSAERKWTVDRDGATKLAAAAAAANVRRFLVVSSMGADDGDPDSEEIFQVYLRAKGEADAAVRASGLDWTIVRPGHLTDDLAKGRVTVAATTGPGQIARDDVAAVLLACLHTPSTIGAQFEVVEGDTAIGDALVSL